MTTTVNYSWALPTVGASINTWGTLVNNILTDIDAKMVSKTDAQTLTNKTLAAPVITGGASISGNVSVSGRVDAKAGNAVRVYRPDDATYGEITHGASGVGMAYNDANGDGHVWRNAGSDKMTLDASGNLLVGAVGGSSHVMKKASAEGNSVLEVGSSTTGYRSALFYTVAVEGWAGLVAALYLGKNSSNGRSINAGGTVNQSGADYAEYERNNGTKFAKGQVVGFKEDGTLTDVYADAIRFGVKSTNPGLVGGDSWGAEKQVGKRPDEPQFAAPEYKGPQDPGPAPIEPVQQNIAGEDKAKVSEDFSGAHAAWVTASAAHEKLAYEYRAAQADHVVRVEVAKQLFDTDTYPEYLCALKAFEARLETARQGVDRIAYCGKVPVAVYDATPGGYIIADKDSKGKIVGKFVADPDFAQYKKAVGRVNRIMDEAASAHLVEAINGADPEQFVGMAEIAVIVN